MRVKVICVGSHQHGDDAAAHLVADLLAGEENIELVRVKAPTEILDKLSGDEELVIIVDAMEKVSSPGRVHRFTSAGSFTAKDPWRSTHNLTLREVLKILESINQLPKDILIYGIEGRSFKYMDTVSEDVAKACRLVADEIRKIAGRVP
jgi:hydrogenase maturation protease